MRYLSRIARETTARFVPATRSGWRPVVPPLVQEQTVEWPATPYSESQPLADNRTARAASAESPAPAARVTERTPPGSASRTFETPASDGEAFFAPAPHPHPEERRPPAARTASEVRVESGETPNLRQPAPVLSQLPDRGEHPPFTGLTAALPTGSAMEAAAESSPSRHEEPPPARTQAGVTLSSVLAEVERRQQELELRYRREQDSLAADRERPEAREQRFATENARPRQSPAEEEEVHLNIGSIVVQLEPEPVVSPVQTPPRRPLRQRDTSNRWARSFLDR